jgi:hemerythrin-like metal-binding protein
MPTLPWSQELELGLPVMDQTHREFVELLARARASSDEALPAAWQVLIEHTQAHFAQEDAWMRATAFASAKRHSVQHRVILQVLREGAARAAEGNLTSVRLMTHELAVWFPQHAQTLDMELASHLARLGFDPATGETRAPQKEHQGCGSCARCSCSGVSS